MNHKCTVFKTVLAVYAATLCLTTSQLRAGDSPKLGSAPLAVAKVVGLQGAVKVVRMKQSDNSNDQVEETLAVAKGMEVFEQDEIIVGEGRVTIIFQDRSLLVLKSGSEFRLSGYALERSKEKSGPGTIISMIAELIRGAAIAEVKNDGRAKDVRIQSGNVVLGIRGTKFGLSRTKDVTELIVAEGRVAVSSVGSMSRPVLVDAGMGSTASQKGTISSPALSKQDRLQGIQADLTYRSPGSLSDDEAVASLPRLTLKSVAEAAPLLSLQDQPQGVGASRELGLRHGFGLRLFAGKVGAVQLRGGEVSYQPRLVKGPFGIYAGVGGGGVVIDGLRSGEATLALGVTVGREGLVGGIEGGFGKWLGFAQKFKRASAMIGYQVGPSMVSLAIDRYVPEQNDDEDVNFGACTTAGLSLRRDL